MSLATALAFILRQETGELVHGRDGLSRWGISQANHPELTAQDIESMTSQRAAVIISGPQYAGAVHFAELPQFLQLPMLDAAVNEGASAALKALQTALYIPADGLWGPQTARAVQLCQASITLARFVAARTLEYSRDATWATDGLGWVTRAALAAMEAAS